LIGSIGRVGFKIVGLYKWNTIPETKFQMVDQKQNGGGSKVKGFKLLSAAILFWIHLLRSFLRYYFLLITAFLCLYQPIIPLNYQLNPRGLSP
jgi:hypothetical protein